MKYSLFLLFIILLSLSARLVHFNRGKINRTNPKCSISRSHKRALKHKVSKTKMQFLNIRLLSGREEDSMLKQQNSYIACCLNWTKQKSATILISNGAIFDDIIQGFRIFIYVVKIQFHFVDCSEYRKKNKLSKIIQSLCQ